MTDPVTPKSTAHNLVQPAQGSKDQSAEKQSVGTVKTDHKINDLLDVMAALRAPDTGCPWDIEQTFSTIAPYTIEEAYEVADAIERNDLAGLKDELGDLLLQVVYHAQMACEQEAFCFEDVVAAITDKMIRRHPHVFGSEEERAQGARPGFWERLKDAERANNPAVGTSQDGDKSAGDAARQSVLDNVPLPLPALTRAVKLQNKAARVGFDWPSLKPVFDKMREELEELEEVVGGDDPGRIEEEYGDLIFVLANVARHLGIDPEQALRATNSKFTRRFQRIEALLSARGKTPAQSKLEEMDKLWDQAKLEERNRD